MAPITVPASSTSDRLAFSEYNEKKLNTVSKVKVANNRTLEL